MTARERISARLTESGVITDTHNGTTLCDDLRTILEDYKNMCIVTGRLASANAELLDALGAWAKLYEGWSAVYMRNNLDRSTIIRIKATLAAIARAKGEA